MNALVDRALRTLAEAYPGWLEPEAWVRVEGEEVFLALRNEAFVADLDPHADWLCFRVGGEAIREEWSVGPAEADWVAAGFARLPPEVAAAFLGGDSLVRLASCVSAAESAPAPLDARYRERAIALLPTVRRELAAGLLELGRPSRADAEAELRRLEAFLRAR